MTNYTLARLQVICWAATALLFAWVAKNVFIVSMAVIAIGLQLRSIAMTRVDTTSPPVSKVNES